MSSVSVIVVNWNSGTLLRACIESVLAVASNSEIVVIDNASIDDSLDRLQHLRNQIGIVRNSVNRGFASAVNQGFEETSTPYVLILNPDVCPAAGSIQLLTQFLESHRRAGAAGGYVNDKYLPRDLPTGGTFARENLGFSSLRAQRQVAGAVQVDQPAAAALLVRRDAYEDTGGFDERFFPAWYEDVDFCLRLKEKGWEIYFVADAQFHHEGGYSAGVLGSKDFADAYYHNQLRYAQKHFGFISRVGVRASIAAGMIVRSVVRPRNAAAYLNVMRGALGGWRR